MTVSAELNESRLSGYSGEADVAVPAAEHDHRVAGRDPVGAGAQPSPDAERVDDADPCAGVEQQLDPTLAGIGLARAGGADDRDTLVQRRDR